jgi:hypothetical protein
MLFTAHNERHHAMQIYFSQPLSWLLFGVDLALNQKLILNENFVVVRAVVRILESSTGERSNLLL